MQVPKYAQPGQPGRELSVILELKTIADVGLIGFPNVGKSTFLSRVSHAKPKIANYHFTTLQPILGVAVIDAGHYGLEHIFIDFMADYCREKIDGKAAVLAVPVSFPAVVW